MNTIKVAVRVRPLDRPDSRRLVEARDNSLYFGSTMTTGSFDFVFNDNSTNSDVYNQLVSPIVKQTLSGFHGTIFAYGMTSSGKTHTMMGTPDDPGIVYRVLADIFDRISEENERQYLCRISFVEIYNENIYDLLEPKNQPYLRTDTQSDSVLLCSCLEFVVMSAEEALDLLERGNQRRHVGVTKMNDRSSRSHAIFRIILESQERGQNSDGSVKISHLNLVDLAGSERATQTGATGSQLRETANINKSLLYLGTLISKLQSNPNGYVNYRDSKLTYMLSNAIGGNSLTAMICCITPSRFHVEVTKSTLDFAMRAQRVICKPKMNEVVDDRALLKRYEKEIRELKEQNLQLLLNQRTDAEEQRVPNTRLTCPPSVSRVKDVNSFDLNYTPKNSENILEPQLINHNNKPPVAPTRTGLLESNVNHSLSSILEQSLSILPIKEEISLKAQLAALNEQNSKLSHELVEKDTTIAKLSTEVVVQQQSIVTLTGKEHALELHCSLVLRQHDEVCRENSSLKHSNSTLKEVVKNFMLRRIIWSLQLKIDL
ncbi:hypothetical protein RCL1_006453 [Eukaryota sp. TZLM3-RCL]